MKVTKALRNDLGGGALPLCFLNADLHVLVHCDETTQRETSPLGCGEGEVGVGAGGGEEWSVQSHIRERGMGIGSRPRNRMRVAPDTD